MKSDETDKSRAWRVVLLDDHPLVRDAYRTLIVAQPDLTVVGSLDRSAELTRLLREISVDVVLLDYRLADDDFDGVPLIQRLRARFPSTRLLVCSASDDPLTRTAVGMAGAQGFLSKRAPLSDCPLALRAVASGQHYFPAPAAVPNAACAAAQDTHAVRHGAGSTDAPCASWPPLPAAPDTARFGRMLPAGLTIKEFDVLRCCQQGLSPTSIAAKFRRSVKTVSGHKVAAFRKLGIETDAQLYARRRRSRDQ